MPKLVAISQVNHDGAEYAPGEAFEVADSKQAALLVDAGAAEDAATHKARKVAAKDEAAQAKPE